AALVMVWLLASWGTESPERATYDKIQVGMMPDEVDAIMSGWFPHGVMGTLRWHVVDWRAPNGATIRVSFDSENRVTEKRFVEGDQSLPGRLKRLAGRLPLR